MESILEFWSFSLCSILCTLSSQDIETISLICEYHDVINIKRKIKQFNDTHLSKSDGSRFLFAVDPPHIIMEMQKKCFCDRQKICFEQNLRFFNYRTTCALWTIQNCHTNRIKNLDCDLIIKFSSVRWLNYWIEPNKTHSIEVIEWYRFSNLNKPHTHRSSHRVIVF